MPERHYVPAPQQPGLDVRQLAAAVVRDLLRQPGYHWQHLCLLLRRLCPTARTENPALHDRRFQHPGWQQGAAGYLLHCWMAACTQGRDWLAGLQLSEPERAALAWLGKQLAALSAPSNSPLNPEFLARLQATRGHSLCQGMQHLLADLSLQRPLAPLNDDTAFHPGRDLATTPGSVISRQPLFELIQYHPTTSAVYHTPLLIIPPPLNRFYLLDLARESSLVKSALDQGQQVFLLSWRNPNPSHCNWGLDTYIAGIQKASEQVRAICASAQINLLGVCSGGLLSLLLQAWLAARNQLHTVASASYLITPLAGELRSDLLQLAGTQSLHRLRRRIWRQGYLSARQLNAAFAWLRPEQLVWPQMVQRYGLGQTPDARASLFWSQDNTRVPARLIDDFLHLFEHDPLATPGALQLHGCSLDIRQIQLPSWHLGAERDHIVPWQQTYPGTRLGGDKHFVLASGGHIQCLLNPVDCTRSHYRSGPTSSADADGWQQAHSLQAGDWKVSWLSWLAAFSAEQQPAPRQPGNPQFPALQAAPGRYVHEL